MINFLIVCNIFKSSMLWPFHRIHFIKFTLLSFENTTGVVPRTRGSRFDHTRTSLELVFSNCMIIDIPAKFNYTLHPLQSLGFRNSFSAPVNFHSFASSCDRQSVLYSPSCLINSSWVPVWTISPSLKTRILSAVRMVRR